MKVLIENGPVAEPFEVDLDNPMVEVIKPDKPGFIYDCPACGWVIVVPRPGFAHGHDLCVGVGPGQHGLVRLEYLGEYYPPTLVWEGDYA